MMIPLSEGLLTPTQQMEAKTAAAFNMGQFVVDIPASTDSEVDGFQEELWRVS